MVSEKEMVKVIQAHIDGKTIEYFPRHSVIKDVTEWWKVATPPHNWNWKYYEYRVKAEPLRLFIVGNGNIRHIYLSKTDAEAMERVLNTHTKNFTITEYECTPVEKR